MPWLLLLALLAAVLFWRWWQGASGQARQSIWRYAHMALLMAASWLMFRFGQTALGSFLLFLFFFSPLSPALRKLFSQEKPASTPTPTTSSMRPEEAAAILGIPADADKKTIREAHRRLINANHPDKGGSSHLAGQINHARDVLLGKKPEKK